MSVAQVPSLNDNAGVSSSCPSSSLPLFLKLLLLMCKNKIRRRRFLPFILGLCIAELSKLRRLGGFFTMFSVNTRRSQPCLLEIVYIQAANLQLQMCFEGNLYWYTVAYTYSASSKCIGTHSTWLMLGKYYDLGLIHLFMYSTVTWSASHNVFATFTFNQNRDLSLTLTKTLLLPKP